MANMQNLLSAMILLSLLHIFTHLTPKMALEGRYYSFPTLVFLVTQQIRGRTRIQTQSRSRICAVNNTMLLVIKQKCIQKEGRKERSYPGIFIHSYHRFGLTRLCVVCMFLIFSLFFFFFCISCSQFNSTRSPSPTECCHMTPWSRKVLVLRTFHHSLSHSLYTLSFSPLFLYGKLCCF